MKRGGTPGTPDTPRDISMDKFVLGLEGANFTIAQTGDQIDAFNVRTLEALHGIMERGESDAGNLIRPNTLNATQGKNIYTFMEGNHSYIQLLLPNSTQSAHNKVPPLTRNSEVFSNAGAKSRIIKSFNLYFDFLKGDGWTVKQILSTRDHNQVRITRVFQCLKEFGLIEQSTQLWNYLVGDEGAYFVSFCSGAFNYWIDQLDSAVLTAHKRGYTGLSKLEMDAIEKIHAEHHVLVRSKSHDVIPHNVKENFYILGFNSKWVKVHSMLRGDDPNIDAFQAANLPSVSDMHRDADKAAMVLKSRPMCCS